jgi:nucleoside-diphosphate-sugar epimerase
VYGPGDYQHRALYWLKPMKLDGRKAIVLGEKYAASRVSRGYVENVGYAIALAATTGERRARNRIYNVADEHAPTFLEWGNDIARVISWNGRIVTAPDEKLPEDLRGIGQDLVVDTSRIRGELGFREVEAYEKDLRRTVEWELANLPGDLAPFQLWDYAAEDEVLSSR